MSLEKEKSLSDLAAERGYKNMVGMKYLQDFLAQDLILPDFTAFKPPKTISGGHRGAVKYIAWSSDSRKLASCSVSPFVGEDVIRIWTPERSTDVRASTELKGHTNQVTKLAWDPVQSERLASVANDATLKFWDIRSPTNTPTSSLDLKLKLIDTTFHPSGNLITASDLIDNVHLIDTRMNRPLGLIMDEGKVPSSFIHSKSPALSTEKANQTRAANGVHSGINGDAKARIKSKTHNPYSILDEKQEINESKFSMDGSLFCMSFGNGNIRMLDCRNLDFENQNHLEVNKDQKTQDPMETEKDRDRDRSKDAVPWEIAMDFRAHSANVFALQFENGGRYMASSAAEATIGIWDTKEFMSVALNSDMEYTARDLSFSHDGEILAAGSEDRHVFLISSSTGKTIHKIPVWGTITTVAWHPSRLLLAYAGEEKDHLGQPGAIKLFGLDTR